MYYPLLGGMLVLVSCRFLFFGQKRRIGLRDFDLMLDWYNKQTKRKRGSYPWPSLMRWHIHRRWRWQRSFVTRSICRLRLIIQSDGDWQSSVALMVIKVQHLTNITEKSLFSTVFGWIHGAIHFKPSSSFPVCEMSLGWMKQSFDERIVSPFL